MMCDMCVIRSTQQGYLMNYINNHKISIVSRNLLNERNSKNEQAKQFLYQLKTSMSDFAYRFQINLNKVDSNENMICAEKIGWQK